MVDGRPPAFGQPFFSTGRRLFCFRFWVCPFLSCFSCPHVLLSPFPFLFLPSISAPNCAANGEPDYSVHTTQEPPIHSGTSGSMQAPRSYVHVAGGGLRVRYSPRTEYDTIRCLVGLGCLACERTMRTRVGGARVRRRGKRVNRRPWLWWSLDTRPPYSVHRLGRSALQPHGLRSSQMGPSQVSKMALSALAVYGIQDNTEYTSWLTRRAEKHAHDAFVRRAPYKYKVRRTRSLFWSSPVDDWTGPPFLSCSPPGGATNRSSYSRTPCSVDVPDGSVSGSVLVRYSAPLCLLVLSLVLGLHPRHFLSFLFLLHIFLFPIFFSPTREIKRQSFATHATGGRLSRSGIVVVGFAFGPDDGSLDRQSGRMSVRRTCRDNMHV